MHSTKVFSALSGSDRPVLLTIDDAQWMDDQSKRVLEAVNAIQPRHLTLLVFSRPNDSVQADLTPPDQSRNHHTATDCTPCNQTTRGVDGWSASDGSD